MIQGSLLSLSGFHNQTSSQKELRNAQIKHLHDYIAKKNQEVSDDDDWEEWKNSLSRRSTVATYTYLIAVAIAAWWCFPLQLLDILPLWTRRISWESMFQDAPTVHTRGLFVVLASMHVWLCLSIGGRVCCPVFFHPRVSKPFVYHSDRKFRMPSLIWSIYSNIWT